MKDCLPAHNHLFNDLIRIIFSQILPQLFNSLPALRLNPIPRYLGKRLQHEQPLRNPWMGNNQIIGAENTIPIEKQIDIQRPILIPCLTPGANPTIKGLDALELLQ